MALQKMILVRDIFFARRQDEVKSYSPCKDISIIPERQMRIRAAEAAKTGPAVISQSPETFLPPMAAASCRWPCNSTLEGSVDFSAKAEASSCQVAGPSRGGSTLKWRHAGKAARDR